MKNTKILLILALSFFFIACNSSTAKKEETKKVERVDMNGNEYTSTYICPMHCAGSGSEEPGVCPVCEMDYVLNENKVDSDSHEGHDHDGEEHEGHNHDDKDQEEG